MGVDDGKKAEEGAKRENEKQFKAKECCWE